MNKISSVLLLSSLNVKTEVSMSPYLATEIFRHNCIHIKGAFGLPEFSSQNPISINLLLITNVDGWRFNNLDILLGIRITKNFTKTYKLLKNTLGFIGLEYSNDVYNIKVLLQFVNKPGLCVIFSKSITDDTEAGIMLSSTRSTKTLRDEKSKITKNSNTLQTTINTVPNIKEEDQITLVKAQEQITPEPSIIEPPAQKYMPFSNKNCIKNTPGLSNNISTTLAKKNQGSNILKNLSKSSLPPKTQDTEVKPSSKTTTTQRGPLTYFGIKKEDLPKCNIRDVFFKNKQNDCEDIIKIVKGGSPLKKSNQEAITNSKTELRDLISTINNHYKRNGQKFDLKGGAPSAKKKMVLIIVNKMLDSTINPKNASNKSEEMDILVLNLAKKILETLNTSNWETNLTNVTKEIAKNLEELKSAISKNG